jgi:hypothetical protein
LAITTLSPAPPFSNLIPAISIFVGGACVKCEKIEGRYFVAGGRKEEREAQTVVAPTSITDQLREEIV